MCDKMSSELVVAQRGLTKRLRAVVLEDVPLNSLLALRKKIDEEIEQRIKRLQRLEGVDRTTFNYLCDELPTSRKAEKTDDGYDESFTKGATLEELNRELGEIALSREYCEITLRYRPISEVIDLTKQLGLL